MFSLKTPYHEKVVMDIISLFLLACALAADAFTVSLCKGFSVKRLELKHYLIVGLYFGGFQALMPSIGYFIGIELAHFIDRIDHWISFVLLTLVGAKMIKESFAKEGLDDKNLEQFSTRTMFVLAIATSIDALAVGLSFAFMENLHFPLAIFTIGGITFILCIFGLKMGYHLGFDNQFGLNLGKKAEFIGGLVLVLLGCKILFGHLFFN